jgi:hypothetical protein
MLDKKVFAREIERLMQFYPTWVIKYDDKVTMENWYKIFEDYKDDEFESSVTNFIKTSKFSPTVAGLIEAKQKYINHMPSKPISELTIDDVPNNFKHWERPKDVTLEAYNRGKLYAYKESLKDDN